MKPSKQTATNPETVTTEKDRIEFDIVPRHPIYGPADDINVHVTRLLPILEQAIEDAARVQENSSGHHVENYAKCKRLHSLLCDLANGMR